MFWGSISGKYGKHQGLFWEKDWETINKGSYSGIIIPIVQEILQQYPELQFQQDNAKGHASKLQSWFLRLLELSLYSGHQILLI